MKFEALRALEEPDKAAIDAFVAANTFPLVAPGKALFVYRGPGDAVRLRQWIYGLPADPEMYRLHQTDLWYLETELPDGSRVEYKYEVEQDGKTRWILDPLNPVFAHDPFGANSVCQAYGYERPEWTVADSEARRGSIDEFELHSAAFGETRRIRVYLPARFRRRRRYPTVLVHDGADFIHYADFTTVLDNLIHRLEVAPCIAAFLDPSERTREYAADPRHSRFLVEEVYPALQKRYPLDEHPEARGVMGASFGAVASLHAAWRHPGFFGQLMLLSGSFAFSDIGTHRRGPTFDPVVEFINGFREAPERPAQRIYMSCGIYESLIYENRSLLPLLRDTGALVRYDEARDGHNWENWRDRQQAALSWLFRGPLWMVYE